MKKEIHSTNITGEVIEAVRELDKGVLIREVGEALDETLDQHTELEEPHLAQTFPMYSREARLVLGNQITILKVLRYLLTGG